MEGNVGHLVTFYFPQQKLTQYVNKGAIRNGVASGMFVEFLCSDKRLGDQIFSEPSVADQIVTVMNQSLGKAGIRVNPSGKGVLTGVGYSWIFQSTGGKVPEPSVTWKTQVVSACAAKLAEYGYEFASQSKGGHSESETFYFVEKRAVLAGLLGP